MKTEEGDMTCGTSMLVSFFPSDPNFSKYIKEWGRDLAVDRLLLNNIVF